MITPKEFSQRRKQFMNKIGHGSIAVLSAAPNVQRTSSATYPYRQDNDFYYLTGFPETNAFAVFAPGCQEGEFILFCQPREPEMEVWIGERVGPAELEVPGHAPKRLDQRRYRDLLHFDAGDLYPAVLEWVAIRIGADHCAEGPGCGRHVGHLTSRRSRGRGTLWRNRSGLNSG